MLRTVFMGTPDFAATCLERLVAEGLPPVAVVCQPARPTGRGRRLTPSAVEAKATENGLEVFAPESVNTPDSIAVLQSYQADLFLVAAFGQLLKPSVLEIPSLFCLNVHGSLLPKYRGAAPIQWAILNGEAETGITIQKMVRRMDAGDTLLQKALPIAPGENAEMLFSRMAMLGADCLVQAVRLVESGSYQFEPQLEAQATQAPKLTKEQAPIDWARPALDIDRQIRGLQPWPIAQSTLGGVRVKIFAATPEAGSFAGVAGSILTDHKTKLTVVCGQGTALSLTRIQLENKKSLEIRDFLAAYRGNFPFIHMG